MRNVWMLAIVVAVACGEATVSAPTPEDLNLLTPTQDVRITVVLPDSSFSRLRLEVEPAQCSDGLGGANPRVEVDDECLFWLGADGRLRRAARADFVVGARVRIWAHPDECTLLSAIALLP